VIVLRTLQTVLSGLVRILITLLPARPSRPNVMSMPSPDYARGMRFM
jgi:hypothetical protein